MSNCSAGTGQRQSGLLRAICWRPGGAVGHAGRMGQVFQREGAGQEVRASCGKPYPVDDNKSSCHFYS